MDCLNLGWILCEVEFLQKRQRENRNIFACIGTLLLYYYVMQGTELPSWFSECCLELPRLNNFDLLVYKIESFVEFTYLSVSYLCVDSLHETHPPYLLTYNLFRLFFRAFMVLFKSRSQLPLSLFSWFLFDHLARSYTTGLHLTLRFFDVGLLGWLFRYYLHESHRN